MCYNSLFCFVVFSSSSSVDSKPELPVFDPRVRPIQRTLEQNRQFDLDRDKLHYVGTSFSCFMRIVGSGDITSVFLVWIKQTNMCERSLSERNGSTCNNTGEGLVFVRHRFLLSSHPNHSYTVPCEYFASGCLL